MEISVLEDEEVEEKRIMKKKKKKKWAWMVELKWELDF